MKRQIIAIHGGDTFNTHEEYVQFIKDWQLDFDRYRNGKKDWKGALGQTLGAEYEVVTPSMPNKMDAHYEEWKIWFEKFIPHLDPEVILIGHSLGGTFLIKYLAENTFPNRIAGLFLIAAPVGDNDHSEGGYSLATFVLPRDLSGVARQTSRIFLYQSKDDAVVSFADFTKLKKALPNAAARNFTDRGHFNQEDFPELVTDIKGL